MGKITFQPAQSLPLDKLAASIGNVRRIKAGVSIAELAEDIGRRGLLQSLNVRPVLDEAGVDTGRFAVVAGGRRLAALQLLVRSKRLNKTAPVPCIVQRADVAPEEDSLAENSMRESLHPLDQFRAFQALHEDHGLGDEAIAARFFVTPAVVRQRLKLAAVSPKLLDLYADEALTLEQLMAFSVTADHGASGGGLGGAEPEPQPRGLRDPAPAQREQRQGGRQAGGVRRARRLCGGRRRSRARPLRRGRRRLPARPGAAGAPRRRRDCRPKPSRFSRKVGSGSRRRPICPTAIGSACGVSSPRRCRSTRRPRPSGSG